MKCERRSNALLWEDVGQDCLRGGLQTSSAETLQNTKEDQNRQAWRDAAEQRTDGEKNNRDQVEPFSSDPARDPAADWKHDRVCNQIGRKYPDRFVQRGRKISCNVRQRDVGNGCVQHFHERRDDSGTSDQPDVVFG
jgi:hypothetical protein